MLCRSSDELVRNECARAKAARADPLNRVSALRIRPTDMDPSPASRDRDFRKKLTAPGFSKPFLHDAFESGLVDQVECQLLSWEHDQRRGFAVGDQLMGAVRREIGILAEDRR